MNTTGNDIWILGATGRIGRALIDRLHERGLESITAVGRDERRLQQLVINAATEVRYRIALDTASTVDAICDARPAIVVNLRGQYAETGPEIAAACIRYGGAYVDIASDFHGLAAMLNLHDHAAALRTTVISGAGFGVVGTQAILARLCAGDTKPRAVQVDAFASFAQEAGKVGEAFAHTSVDIIATGGLIFRDGQLHPTALGSRRRHTTLPDETQVVSAAVAGGELLAARITSGASDIEFTSGLAPTSILLRPLLPALTKLARRQYIRRVLLRRLAMTTTSPEPAQRPYSWGHAQVTWDDGSIREGWLRTGDAMEFTAEMLSTVVGRLVSGERPIGAHTPVTGYGANIAVAAGATLIDASSRQVATGTS